MDINRGRTWPADPLTIIKALEYHTLSEDDQPWNSFSSPLFSITCRFVKLPSTAKALTPSPVTMPSNNQTNDRKETEYRLGLASPTANALQKQGLSSGERRGKTYNNDPYKMPTTQEESQLTKAANVSSERRKHVTENVASSYRESK
ncbi:uncharacterized protein DSM5745_09296 [Aspergillus mulundensis]|uniref:Uncharacterized protein n=1 Tax=Aspergillus mulundensis TaxID=1810919 RepID=A0A3D8R0I0_9EURO|nr:hypothetical protein DSM5745_09296 [Aspergillus mulundensis]RDW67430.1 hypothetical protein DSM5745_09296 [Aspergillus mulundensis]